MMERLEELGKLHIQSCDSLEEIIEPQGLIDNESLVVTATQFISAETVTAKFVFPKLTYLRFDKLDRLKSLYSRMHTIKWPLLKKMDVIECPKVQIFAPQCPCSEKTQTESQVGISNQKPLFYVNEDTFPILEECFRELKVLNLKCFPETSTTLPYCFIHSLPNLQKLLINDASICQIVQSEGLSDEGRHTSALIQIKELRLSKLTELSLKTLEPSLLSLKNLTTLEVSKCHGFIKLMACSTAKSLMLLKRMSITDCEMIEEIIACEGEEIQSDIVLPQLKYLQLRCLPSLAGFSLVDHMFEFPLLQTVIVRKCKRMRNFCQGNLSTPKLQQMHLTRDGEDELWWEGDLNTTIKHMFNGMNVQNSDVTEVPHQ